MTALTAAALLASQEKAHETSLKLEVIQLLREGLSPADVCQALDLDPQEVLLWIGDHRGGPV